MERGEDQVVFCADADALLTDRRHRFAGDIKIARPGTQQRQLNARTKSQRDWPVGVCKVDGTFERIRVKTTPTHEV